MSIENNPLRQYFRRPAVFVKLPSGGKNYPLGVIDLPESGEVAVFPMTAIDEITTKTPDALFNGTAVVELIKSCIPSIKNPWLINSNDLDAILIAIKSASGGNELEIESQCPSCENISDYTINLIQILGNMKAGDYDKLLPLGELQIKFKPLSYKEMNEASLGQFEVQRSFVEIENEPDQEVKNKKGQEALKKVTELTMKTLQSYQYLTAEEFAKIKKPNELLEKQLELAIANGHKALDYMQQSLQIMGKNIPNV